MIKIRASQLENLRANPESYGSLLASGGLQAGRGSRGMFGCFIDVARSVHVGGLNKNEAIQELHRKFSTFVVNPENETRQARLATQLVRYLNNYEKNGFKFVNGAKKMEWGITSDVMLTGFTPWLVQNSKGYFSYLLSEKTIDWKPQLRFPLFQQFITDNTIDYVPEDMAVGFYFADTGKFDFCSYSQKDLAMAVDETGKMFTTMYKAFNRRSKS